MIEYIEKSVRTGRHAAIMRVLLAIAAWLLPPPARSNKLSTLVFEGRLLIEHHAGRYRAAEDLFFRHAKKRPLTFWAISSYIEKVVDTGNAQRLNELLHEPRLSPGATVLLQQAVSRLKDKLPEQTPVDNEGYGQERLAEDKLAFAKAEPDYTDLPSLISAAILAEVCGREDIFAGAITLLLEKLKEVEQSEQLTRKHVRDVVTAKLTLFDLQGAEDFLNNPVIACTNTALKVSSELKLIIQETCDYNHVIREAHQDILARAAGERPSVGDFPIIVLPAAALRKNRVDYTEFRSDIRFVLAAIVKALETRQVTYGVRSRLKTHGVLDLPTPFFSYHTVSSNSLGLHFKETDRPSLFSFDRRGYAGWSEFSQKTFAEFHTADIPAKDAREFFELEKVRVIGGNLSKYRQAKVSTTQELPEKFIFVGLQIIGDAVAQLAYLSLFEMLDEVVKTARAHGLSVVVKRHPLCVSPEVSRCLSELVSQGAVHQVFSSIHAIVPEAEAVCVINSGVGAEALLHEKPVYVFGRADYMAACFVCKKRGDFSDEFALGRSRLSPEELRMFWYLLRKRYAVDLRDRDHAASEIEARVVSHLKAHGALDMQADLQH